MAKRFSEEFKRRAVELYLARGKDISVADELEIGRSTLKNWVAIYRNELNPVLINEAEEAKRLRKENIQLKEELAILKKAAAFFARDQIAHK